MILYTKRFYGLSLMFQMFGSALPRSLPFAVVGGIVAYVLRIYCAEFLDTVWKHPFPFQAISFIAGFLVTFRANLGYQRYWEGCTNLRIMSQRLADAAVQVVTFDVGALPEDASEEILTDAAVFRDTYLHLTSLLHATALQSLCKEENTRNFIMHNSLHHTPKEDAREEEVAAAIHAQHMGMASWQDLFILRGRVAPAASPRRRDRQRIILPVLGGVCNEESVAMGALDMTTNQYFQNPAEFQGFLLHNGMFAPRSASRVQTVMTWLQQCIMERRREGGLQVPAPLLTRMYQLLSDGMLGYEQCRKLSRIPFPFPHAQMVTATLLLFTLTLPIMIAAFISSPSLAAMLSAMTQVLYWGTHEVARELEDPFLIWSTTYNCLPFSSMQWSFNEDILAFAYSVKPPEATRANGLFPSLHTRIPVRRYTKPLAGSVAEGTVAHPPADSHLPGLATMSRLASIAPPGCPTRASCLSSPSYSGNTPTGGPSTPSEVSFSAFIPTDTHSDYTNAAAGGSSGSRGGSRRGSTRGAGSSGVSGSASAAATPRMRQALPAEALAAAAHAGVNQVSSRGGLPRAASSSNTTDIEATLAAGMHADHAHLLGTSAPAAPQSASFVAGEAASPVMAGASVAEVHSAAADAEGVHRGAVSGRGHASFADPPVGGSQIQVDMPHPMDDVMGTQTHDRDDHMHDGAMPSIHMREASFGGSLRTPLAHSGKLRGIPGASSGESMAETLASSGSQIRKKISGASDCTDDLEGDVHKPLLQ